jgi:hypothetical protein
MLPVRNVWQQQKALMVYSENVQLWHPFLAKSDTSDTFEIWEGGYLAWRFQFLGRKRAYTLLNVYLIASHLVE